MADGSPFAAVQPSYDIVLDLSEHAHPCPDVPFDAEAFGFAAGRVSTLRPGPAGRVRDAWWLAVGAARQGGRHLLVIRGPLAVAPEIIPLLLAEFEADPMLGTAQPRFMDASTDGIWPLPPEAGDGEQTSRAALPLLPETVITTEILAACLLIRREVVATVERPGAALTLAGTISRELTRARRRGFRNVVVNRAVVRSTLNPRELYPAVPPEDAVKLDEAFPDRALAAEENRALHQRSLEALLSAAYPPPGQQRRLLLDCRGMEPMHNGTSKCVLGLLDGFAASAPDWSIHVQSTREAAVFHQLAARYGRFVHQTGPLQGAYAAALLPNQPWTLDHLAELHRHGFVVGCNILDTISWDILYVGPHRLDRTWRFAARHADILTFISAFTRDRFRRRFRVTEGVRDEVVRLSLAAKEQRIEHLRDLPPSDHVLLFGNAYEHKGLEPAVRLLAAAFPFQRFVVLGGGEGAPANVQAVASGGLGAEQVHRLAATARAIVYPSFYEGFGLPVLEGLAYGRPVLVRRSPLWAEIAAHARLDGPLIEFADDIALIETLGALLAGDPITGLPFGAALPAAQEPSNWQDAAAALLRLVEERLAAPDIAHWLERAENLRLAGF